MRKWKFFLAGLSILAVLAGGWWQRHSLQGWYYLHRLNQADEIEQEDWVEKLVAMGDPIVPTLIGSLSRHDESTCEQSARVLGRLAQEWGRKDPRRTRLASRLAGSFSRFSQAGQRAALGLIRRWVDSAEPGAPGEAQALAIHILPAASRCADVGARAAALELAATLLKKSGPVGGLAVYRDLVRGALDDPAASNRVLAIRLASHRDLNMLARVGPLLDDPAAEVRRAAMLAVGDRSDAVATDDLLRSLHDPDAEVRQLCEAALKSRSLRHEDLTLARMITDPNAQVRRQVPQALARATDLDVAVWLRRLSHDAEPAVRVAAIRAAAEQYDVDLSDRLEQIAASDPSPTVRQIADHYRRQSRTR